MGFSGGGSNVLLNHTHDGRTAQDGGALNFSNITQSQSASGEIFYSDGIAIQQLPVGAPNDEIRVSGANLPEWYTPAAAGSNYEFLGSATAVATSPITVSFSAVSNPSYVVAVFAGTPAGSQEVAFQVNGITTSTYNNQGSYFDGGVQTMRNVAGNDKFYGIDSGISGNGVAYAKFFTNPVNEEIFMSSESYTDHGGSAGGYSSMGGYNSTASQTSISSITCLGNPFDGTLSCWAVRN